MWYFGMYAMQRFISLELDLQSEEYKRLEAYMKFKKVSTISEAVIALLDQVEMHPKCQSCGKKFVSYWSFPQVCPHCGKAPYSLSIVE